MGSSTLTNCTVRILLDFRDSDVLCIISTSIANIDKQIRTRITGNIIMDKNSLMNPKRKRFYENC